MAKPSTLPEWNTDATNRVEPSGGTKATGYASGAKPTSGNLNWFKNLVYQWCAWLDTFLDTAHTWSALQTLNAGLTVAGTVTLPAPTVTNKTTGYQTGWAIGSSGTLGYWKDHLGNVHLQGSVDRSTGGGSGTDYVCDLLPAGFRPTTDMTFAVFAGNGGTYTTGWANIDSNGHLNVDSGLANGRVVSLWGINFKPTA